MTPQGEIDRLVIRLIGDARGYLEALNEVRRETRIAMQDVARTVQVTGAAVSGAIGAGGVFSLDEFRKFDKALTESVSIMNVTVEKEREIADAAMELGSKAIHGPQELAKAFYYLASAGMDANQSIAALAAVEKFAVAGNFDLSAATTYAADAQAAMGLKSKNAETNMRNLVRITDVLVKADTLANATVLQFSRALTRQAGGSLKAFGKDLEEGVAVLAAYADQGVKAQLAGTQLSMIIRHLNKNALKNASAFKQNRIAVFDAKGEMRNFADIIGDMERAFAPMSDELRAATLLQLGFEARMQQSILPLLGTSEAIRSYEKELRKASGFTEKVATRQIQSFHNQMKITWNLITSVAIDIGKELAPAFLVLSEAVRFGLSFWKDLTPAVKTAVVAIAAGTAAFAALGATIFTVGLVFNKMFGGVGIILGVLVTAVSAATGAFAGLGVGVAHNMGLFSEAKRHMSDFWNMLRPVRKAVGSLSSTLLGVASGLLDMAKGGNNFLAGITAGIADFNLAIATLETGIYAIEFAFHEAEMVGAILWKSMEIGIEAVKNEFSHSFAVVIPTVVARFGQIAVTVFTKLFSYVFNGVKTIGSNFYKVFTSIPDLISGKKTLSQLSKELEQIAPPKITLDDFKIDIPERELTDLEKQLREELAIMADVLGEGFDAFIAGKVRDHLKIKHKAQAEDDMANEASARTYQELNKEILRFDAAITGSAEALSRITEYQGRMTGEIVKSREDPRKNRIAPAQVVPPNFPVDNRRADVGGQNMLDILNRIAAATEAQLRKPGIELNKADLG